MVFLLIAILSIFHIVGLVRYVIIIIVFVGSRPTRARFHSLGMGFRILWPPKFTSPYIRDVYEVPAADPCKS